MPVVIFIRILELIGAIPFLAKFLEPLTSFIGIDGSLGLVWMAAILVNIYAGLAAFASLQAIFDYTIAETTILGLIILIAHSLPIEVAIAKKSRISWAFFLAKKFGSSDDLGSFVAMFCSEQASYVIGQSLVIDGGIGNTTF